MIECFVDVYRYHSPVCGTLTATSVRLSQIIPPETATYGKMRTYLLAGHPYWICADDATPRYLLHRSP